MIDVTPHHPSLSSFCSLYFPTLDLLIQNQKHLPNTRVKKVTLGNSDPGSCGRNQETIVYL